MSKPTFVNVDKNGRVLKVGDVVNVPMIVKAISPSDEYSNVQLETVHPHYPKDWPSAVNTLNTQQLELVAKGGEPDDRPEPK
jgi:hypothetical protein